MKKIILILSAVLIFGCSQESRQFIACSQDQRKQVAEFVKSSLLDANNKSDEEMEDVINQLEITGRNCLCGRQMMFVKYGGGIDYETSNAIEGVSYH